MQIYFKGGDTNDASRFEPQQLPTMDDTVIFDHCTEDVICNYLPMWGALKLTDFKNSIQYNIPSLHFSGVLRHHEVDILFSFMTHIRKVE